MLRLYSTSCEVVSKSVMVTMFELKLDAVAQQQPENEQQQVCYNPNNAVTGINTVVLH